MIHLLSTLPHELAWPVAAALAWLSGELAHRWVALPRISVYSLVGFVLGGDQLGWLRHDGGDGGDGMLLLAQVAFGLVLFETGFRVNLRWLQTNRWLAMTGVLESGLTFVAVLWLAQSFGLSTLNSTLVASLAMSTSPATLLRVINERRSSGQVSERALHLSVVDCVLAVFLFTLVLGARTFDRSGDLWLAAWNSLVNLTVSAGLGALVGIAVPGLLRRLRRLPDDASVAFALGVLVLVALTHALRFSPVLASLTFGLMARHRRVMLTRTQRNFGVLGDLLTVLLFMFVASTLSWQRIGAGLGLALALLAVRAVSKVAVATALARPSGITLRKGWLTGVAMMPMSVFVILMLEQARRQGIDLLDQVAPLAGATLILELAGPILVQWALKVAGESGRDAGA